MCNPSTSASSRLGIVLQIVSSGMKLSTPLCSSRSTVYAIKENEENNVCSVYVVIDIILSDNSNTNLLLISTSDCSLLAVPRVRTCFGSRSFAVAAPTAWNSLSLHIHNSSSIFGFRRQLKTYYSL